MRQPGTPTPASTAQQRLWLQHESDPSGVALNVGSAMDLRGAVDVPALRVALGKVIGRHEILRTRYLCSDTGELRAVPDLPETAPLTVVDAREATEDDVDALVHRAVHTPFDLAADQPVRVTLYDRGTDEDGAGRYTLLLVAHHIAWDDACWQLFFDDLSEAVEGRDRGPAVCHADAALAQERALARSLPDLDRHWSQVLDGAEGVAGLRDRDGADTRTAPGRSLEISLDSAESATVDALARSCATTPFAVLLSSLAAALRRHGSGERQLIASPVTLRDDDARARAIGYFGNVVLLPLPGDPRRGLREAVGDTGRILADAIAHQDLPYDRTVRLLGAAGRDQPVDVSFAVEDVGVHLRLPGVEVTSRQARTDVLQVPLSVLARREPAGHWVLRFAFMPTAFTPDRVRSVAHTTRRVLLAGAATPNVPLGNLRRITEEERIRLLRFGSSAPFPGPATTVVEKFEARVAAHPEAVALRGAEGTMTYGELNDRANAVARRLAARGLGTEDPVACALERSFTAVAVTLGVLKSGAVLVPLDVAHPRERLERLLLGTRPRHLITMSATDSLVPGDGVPRTVADSAGWLAEVEAASGGADVGDRDRVRPLHADNLAYVIHTSGSTGAPKAVGTTHAALGEHLEWLVGRFRDSHAENERVRWLQLASPAFDVSLGEVLGPLVVGGEVLVPRADVEKDLDALFAELAELEASVVHAVPSFLHYLVSAAPRAKLPALRWLPVGGEALPGDLADRVLARFGSDGRSVLGNFYGPTETTQAVTGYAVTTAQGPRTVPIGRPKWGNTALVLDADLAQVPPGEVGELYLEGSSLARGYLGRPALTAERFVPSPLTPGARLYRTGDLARFNDDGDLEFAGRVDDQVKIRGFRVEPGEVEAVLRADEEVGSAVVVPREDEHTGIRLVAYVTPGGDGTLDVAALRQRMAGLLPRYLVPGAFVVLDALPLTPAGKTDRRALPDAPPAEADVFRPAAAGLERRIALLFATLLAPRDPSGAPDGEAASDTGARAGAEPTVDGRRVGADTSFFALGGHSLLLTRLVSRLHRDHGVRLDLREAFARATPRELARLVREAAGTGAPDTRTPTGGASPRAALTARPRPEVVPMSAAQRRIWFVDRVEQDSTTYNIPLALEFTGPLDVAALRQALGDVVRRHESLRTVFPDRGGVGHQEILDHHEVALRVVDQPEDGLSQALADHTEHPFDLARERPLRAALFRVAEHRHVLSLLLHHIVCDEVSAGLLVADLTRAYGLRARGESGTDAPVLPVPTVHYADYTLWQREWEESTEGREEAARQSEFWRDTLADLPQDTAVLLDRPRPARPDRAGGVVPFGYDAEVRRGVEELAARLGSTPFIVLQTAVALLLGKLGAGDDVPLGTPIANRPDEAVDEVVGLFVNLLVVRNDLSGDPTLEEVVRRATTRAAEAYQHAGLPFEKVVEAVGVERSLAVNPLFQVLVQLRAEEVLRGAVGDLTWRSLTRYTATAKYDLSVDFEPCSATGGWIGELIYRRDLYDEHTVRQLVDRLGLILRTLATEPTRRLHTLDLVSDEERRLILREWSRGPLAVPDRAETLPELVERSRTTPAAAPGGRVAVECAGETLDYADLHERSDRLARLLLRRGAGPERFVALAVPRSIDMVVALLATVKTGAAYLPLDLRLPAERVAFMVSDAAPVAVVTRSDAPLELPEADGPPVLRLDDPEVAAELDTETAEPLPAEVSRAARGENIAYFLYTSGSTGVPKGVLGTHRAYAARLTWQPVRYPIASPDVRLCQGWLSFHDGGCEILAGLLAGAKLVLADEAEARDVGSLVRLIRDHPIGQVTAVPTAINALIGASPEAVRSVPRWISSGEPMTPALLDRLRATAPESEIVNNYGATELSGGVVRGPLHSAGLHLGTPVDGARVLVLDEHLNLCPPGVTGEVYAAGHQLARSYWRRPALTAARFIPDPYADTPGSVLYRTGDRARWSADGRLLFGGRTDHQVKVRGIRVELGEIEAALRAAPGVAASAARVHESGGSAGIAGYLTLTDPGADPEPVLNGVREHLTRVLPVYLHPSALTVLESMPLTGSGKLDRQALPLPDITTSGARRPARTETERLVAELLGEVLKVEDVGRDDGFFALGGDSIVSVQLASRARARGLPLTAQMVFENPTVAELATACDEAAARSREPSRSTATGRPGADASGLDQETLQALLGSWNPN
ncbi:amino acid adenylation domain-containing protein [Streptomyces chumphonensis]|uniref:Amino acid adenylation domain-containing protein n=1 Tax=Streptomyces chumphonensis TaxID=1214925 RepID=A0A927F015_9ACTN|nr:non-ribosomal peptide synthetase [Streptomyces chumphonensis]MBD3933114.1 amino acid adenylation domain-containing protein [Streptomyces chumphonensis]